jgi:hypothetical protein
MTGAAPSLPTAKAATHPGQRRTGWVVVRAYIILNEHHSTMRVKMGTVVRWAGGYRTGKRPLP